MQMCGKHLLALASGMVLRFAFRNNTLFLLLCYLVIGVVHMRYLVIVYTGLSLSRTLRTFMRDHIDLL
uniref:Uncharacterized protein n=1 Tax=Glossina palpalis gambiensis TaxID=67801 RepID=A0A1B0AQI6_9MUSC